MPSTIYFKNIGSGLEISVGFATDDIVNLLADFMERKPISKNTAKLLYKSAEGIQTTALKRAKSDGDGSNSIQTGFVYEKLELGEKDIAWILQSGMDTDAKEFFEKTDGHYEVKLYKGLVPHLNPFTSLRSWL